MNCLLFLQYRLLDDLVMILPYAVLWIRWLPRYTQNFDLKPLVFTTGLPMLTLLACVARQSGSHWCVQFLASVLNGFFEFLCPQGQWNKFLVIFRDNGVLVLHWTGSCFSFILAFLPNFTQSSGHEWSGLDVNCFLVSLHPDHIFPSGGFSSNRVNRVKPEQESDKCLDPSMFQRSSMRRLLFNIQIRSCSFWIRQWISVEKGMILLSASKVWLWVQRDGGIWSFLTWTLKHLWSSGFPPAHPDRSFEALPGQTPFHPKQTLCGVTFQRAHPLPAILFFGVHDHGRQRSS